MKLKEIVIKNIEALQALRPELGSNEKIAKRCGQLGYRVGKRTVGHLLDIKDEQSPTLKTIAAVAAAFSVPPWMLLSPEFDPQTRNLRDLPPPEILNTARRLHKNQAALAAIREALADAPPSDMPHRDDDRDHEPQRHTLHESPSPDYLRSGVK